MSIALLDPVVADAIAAGEVVERPASVLKELLENAIDAGARNIVVEVEGAGAERIAVIDDGAGIAAGELALAFRRHATSKLSSIEDLAMVRSLGFRGEALASIAAVSRVTCRSTARGAPHGGAVEVDFGVVGEARPAPPVPGTRVEVSGLFENTPARRAFLKRPATEVGAMLRVATALGLCHPEVAIRVIVDGRRALTLPGGGDLGATFAAASSGLTPASLMDVSGARGDAAVEGLVVEPRLMRRSRDHLYLGVNGRPVVSRSLAFAVEQAYRGLAEPGLFPAGVLLLRLPAELVDVNIHPTKREVRFRDERALFGLLQESCLAALARSTAYAGHGLLSSPAGDVAPATVAEARASYEVPAAWQIEPALDQLDMLRVTGPATAAIAPRPLLRGPFYLVGQLLDSYIVAEGPDGLVVVDQHAAHERIIYNQLIAAGGSRTGGAGCQPLLVPVVLHLTPAQRSCLADNLEALASAGIEIEEFGGDAARVVAVDPRVPERGIEQLTLDVLDDLLSEGREIDLHRRLERATYTVACHSAVRFGQRLSRDEMEALLRELEVAEPAITCPHGRPTMLEISEARLRREFKRS